MKDKGLKTQNDVQDVFDSLMSNPEFVYYRFPDARTCGGRISRQPADFIVGYRGKSALVEVKEMTNGYRLARTKISQLPAMTRFEMTHNSAFVVIHVIEDRIHRWGFCRAGSILEKLRETGKASVDVRDVVAKWWANEVSTISGMLDTLICDEV